jgi:hypothetical protein
MARPRYDTWMGDGCIRLACDTSMHQACVRHMDKAGLRTDAWMQMRTTHTHVATLYTVKFT